MAPCPAKFRKNDFAGKFTSKLCPLKIGILPSEFFKIEFAGKFTSKFCPAKVGISAQKIIG